MGRSHLHVHDQPRGNWVGLVAALILAALPLLAASAFGAPAAQIRHPVSYLPLVKGLPLPPYYRIAFVSSRHTNGGTTKWRPEDGELNTHICSVALSGKWPMPLHYRSCVDVSRRST